MGSRRPPLLPAGSPVHPLLRPRPPPVAPPDEGCQREDHPLVPRVAALPFPGGPQAGGADGRGRFPLPFRGGGVGLRPDGSPACVGRWGYVEVGWRLACRGSMEHRICWGNQEVCIYVSALPFSKKRERDGTMLDPTGKTSVQGTETLAAERARC